MFFVYTDALIIYTFPLHIYTFSSLKQSGDTLRRERALRNVSLQKNHFRHAFGFVICTCYLSRDTLKVVLLIGVLWTFDFSFHTCQNGKKKKKGKRLHYSHNQEICFFFLSLVL